MSPETIAVLLKGCTKEQTEKLLRLYLKETPYDFQLIEKPKTDESQLSIFEQESLQ